MPSSVIVHSPLRSFIISLSLLSQHSIDEEESKKAKYSVDEDTGAIKVATSEEKALTWPEAEKLSKQ
ncbi:unnamed protein product, partial [marine sediment metagenome]